MTAPDPDHTTDPAHPGWHDWFVRLRACTITIAVLSAILLVGAIATASTLPVAAWNRVAAVVLLSLFYLFLVFRLGRGSSRALRRLHVTVIIGIVGVALVVVLPGQYPWWMRAEQAVQLLLLLAMGYIIRRPEVRAAFPGWSESAVGRRRRARRSSRT
ncbi:MAG TPA: hypothetical protein VH008_16355 [Pseudonocardia sp.]|nr:hypothetical protein [Pseudonocardia sp.]